MQVSDFTQIQVGSNTFPLIATSHNDIHQGDAVVHIAKIENEGPSPFFRAWFGFANEYGKNTNEWWTNERLSADYVDGKWTEPTTTTRTDDARWRIAAEWHDNASDGHKLYTANMFGIQEA